MRRALGHAILLLAALSPTARAESPAPAPSLPPALAAPAPQPSGLEEPGCDDEEARRKGVQKRELLKKYRGEISAWGGLFAQDLVSTSYGFGGALSFYITEDLGVEASLLVTHFDLAVEKPLTDLFAGQSYRPSFAYAVVGNVLWSPVHLKVRATDHAIVHGDLFFVLGAGDTINDSVQGVTFDAGLGLKLYFTRWFGIRFDLRDYLMVQEALGVQRVANNIAALAGVTFFLPP